MPQSVTAPFNHGVRAERAGAADVRVGATAAAVQHAPVVPSPSGRATTTHPQVPRNVCGGLPSHPKEEGNSVMLFWQEASVLAVLVNWCTRGSRTKHQRTILEWTSKKLLCSSFFTSVPAFFCCMLLSLLLLLLLICCCLLLAAAACGCCMRLPHVAAAAVLCCSTKAGVSASPL